MDQRSTFEVDLADPQSVKAQLAELDEQIARKRAVIQVAQNDLAYWVSMRRRLGIVAGEPAGVLEKVLHGVGQVAQEMAVAVTIQSQVETTVKELVGPLTANDVLARLTPETKRETVNYALWKAAREGRITNLSQGVYAALEYEPPALPPGFTSPHVVLAVQQRPEREEET
jgi:hypothetical protein